MSDDHSPEYAAAQDVEVSSSRKKNFPERAFEDRPFAAYMCHTQDTGGAQTHVVAGEIRERYALCPMGEAPGPWLDKLLPRPPRETSADKPISPERSSLSSNTPLLSAYRTRTVSAETGSTSSGCSTRRQHSSRGRTSCELRRCSDGRATWPKRRASGPATRRRRRRRQKSWHRVTLTR